MIINNLNLSGNLTKTIYIDRVDNSTSTICIIDAEVSSIVITGDCSNGVKVAINESNQGYNVTEIDNGTRLKITGLRHSAVSEYKYTAPVVTSGGSGGGGGGSSAVQTVKESPVVESAPFVTPNFNLQPQETPKQNSPPTFGQVNTAVPNEARTSDEIGLAPAATGVFTNIKWRNRAIFLLILSMFAIFITYNKLRKSPYKDV